MSTLIPERTIDAWTSSAITDRQPRALIWAPTPPSQGPTGDQPWDFAVETLTKLLVIENKSLLNTSVVSVATRVAVGFPQLIRLWVHDRADGLPIFYGLPGLGPDDLPTPIPPEPFVQRAGWRLRPPFDGWQRMVRPLEVLTIGKVFDAFMRGQEGVTIDTALLQPFRSLGALIDDVLGCREGRQMPPDPRAPGWPLLRSLSDRSLSDIARRLKTDLRSPSELPERLDELLRLPEFSEETALATPEVSSATQMGRLMWLAIPIAGGR